MELSNNPTFAELCPQVRNLLTVRLDGTAPCDITKRWGQLKACASQGKSCSCANLLYGVPVAPEAIKRLKELKQIVSAMEEILFPPNNSSEA